MRRCLVQNQGRTFDLVRTLSDCGRRGVPSPQARSPRRRRPAAHQTTLPETTLVAVWALEPDELRLHRRAVAPGTGHDAEHLDLLPHGLGAPRRAQRDHGRRATIVVLDGDGACRRVHGCDEPLDLDLHRGRRRDRGCARRHGARARQRHRGVYLVPRRDVGPLIRRRRGGTEQPGAVVDTGDTRMGKTEHHGGAVHAQQRDGATAQAPRHDTAEMRACAPACARVARTGRCTLERASPDTVRRLPTRRRCSCAREVKRTE